MRYAEILGTRTYVSLDEQQICDAIVQDDSKKISEHKLDEFQQNLAEKMVSRGILNSDIDESGVQWFTLNNLQDYTSRF